jgi:hypothetical protein
MYAAPKIFFFCCHGDAYKMKTATNVHASEVERKIHELKNICNKCYNLSNKKRFDSKNTKCKRLKTKKGRPDLLHYQMTPMQSGSTRERTIQEGSDKPARGSPPQLRKRATQGVAGGAGGRVAIATSHRGLSSQKRQKPRTKSEQGGRERGARSDTPDWRTSERT